MSSTERVVILPNGKTIVVHIDAPTPSATATPAAVAKEENHASSTSAQSGASKVHAFFCSACKKFFNDSRSIALHRLTKKHKNLSGEHFDARAATAEITLDDLRHLIARKQSGKLSGKDLPSYNGSYAQQMVSRERQPSCTAVEPIVGQPHELPKDGQ